MSGICGIFNLTEEKIAEENMSRMMDASVHLGPDGSKYIIRNNFAIGFQKRIITPQDKLEDLPYEDKDSSLTIAADSRLDNREDLIKYLALDEELKDSCTDSFLILTAFKKWGPDCVHHLLGEYIVIIFDRSKNELICFSDHIRNLPVHYYRTDKVFVFSTEINGVLAHPDVPRRLNQKKLAVSAAYTIAAAKFHSPDETYYDKIYRTEPASILLINRDNFSVKRYWEPQRQHKYIFNSDEGYFCQLKELLFASVNDRLRSVHPAASLLSGGLDSSAIVSILLKLLDGNAPLTTFSSVSPENYKNSYLDEKEYIDVFKDYKNIRMNYIANEDMGPFDNIEQLIKVTNKPFHTSRHYLYTAFANSAYENNIRILFDGVGGEFGATHKGTGYTKQLFMNLELLKLYNMLKDIAGVEKISLLNSIKKNLLKEIIPYGLYRFIKFGFKPAPNMHPMNNIYTSSINNMLTPNELTELDDIKKSLENNYSYKKELEIKLKFLSGNDGNNFVGYEKVKMLFPFFDKRLIEFYLDMPAGLTIQNGYKRYAVRGALEGILPEKIRMRITKAPFSPDYYRRFNQQFEQAKEYFYTYSKNELVKTFINTKYVEKILDKNYNQYKKGTSLTEYFTIPNAIYLAVFLDQF